MAASRHLALSALAEPALMLAVFTLAIAARSTDPQRTRFARKAAMAVGGLALMTSTIHFTMQARIDADRTLEA